MLSYNLSLFLTFQIKNLSAMEVNMVRPFVVRALQAFYKHDSPELIDQPDITANRQPRVSDSVPRVSHSVNLLVYALRIALLYSILAFC